MKAFCEECRDYVNYIIKENYKIKNVKGKEIKYKEKSAYCNECKSELFVSDIRDENLRSLDLAYRNIEGLITVDEIVSILDMYNIGKRPLSILLGWGETTLTRFANGDIPSKTYSDTLKKIKDSPKYLLEILTNNKEKLTEHAYNKCFEAINQKISSTHVCFVNSKIESVANYIINKSIEITPLALQKLLYFSQSFHKVFFDTFLFDDDCEAWAHGPVYKEIYFKYKYYGYNPIDDDVNKFSCFDLSDNELEIIDSVINSFGCYSGKILENMTHLEVPWKKTRLGLSYTEPSNKIINKKLIEDYFKLVQNKYDMLNIADIKDYSKDLFDKISH